LDVFHQKWAYFVDSYPPGVVEVYFSALTQVFGFLMPGMVFLLFDISFCVLGKYVSKIQAAHRQPSLRMLWKCFCLVMLNHILLIGGHTVMLGMFGFKYSLFRIEKQLPSVQEIVGHFAFGVVLREILFYYVHRLMHTRWFYGKFHRVHHEFTAPVAMAAVYSHPVDHFLQNAFPITAPMVLLRAHMITTSLFGVVMLVDAAVAHSGYQFPRLPSVYSHDIHHMRGHVQYGVLGLMDWAHSTRMVDDVKRVRV
jgi:fatty acid hydroxylase domain-containing protein 2